MVVVPAFDFIRLDIKAHFTIFGVNVSWEWWVNGKKRSFRFRIPLSFSYFGKIEISNEKKCVPGWAHNLIGRFSLFPRFDLFGYFYGMEVEH